MRWMCRWTSSCRCPQPCICCGAEDDDSRVLARTRLLVTVMQGFWICAQIWELIGHWLLSCRPRPGWRWLSSPAFLCLGGAVTPRH